MKIESNQVTHLILLIIINFFGLSKKNQHIKILKGIRSKFIFSYLLNDVYTSLLYFKDPDLNLSSNK